MIGYARFFIYLAFLGAMIAMGISNQQLRTNVDILQSNCENYLHVIEVKDFTINTLERNLRSIEKLSVEREEKIEIIEIKLRKAKAFLEELKDEGETELSDAAMSVLQSIGIVREEGSKDGVRDGIQGDITAGTMDDAKGGTGDEGQDL